MTREFSQRERAVLALAQANLPHSPTPYASMANEAGVSEEEVLTLLRELKASGAIRRFGATIRHNRAGWSANAMVAWRASEDEAGICGPIAAGHPRVSHAYFRPSAAPDWPYTLYTMIHGRNDAECQEVVDWLLAHWPLQDYAVLRTRRELKKISMTYF